MADAKEAVAKEDDGKVSIKPDLEKYVDGVSGSGKKTKRSDHPVSQALDGMSLDEVFGVASKMCDITQKDLKEKYGHLNVGMQRMNLGNRIRGAVQKLDKMHEADKAVVPGLKTLALECEKPQAAVAKRAAAKAKEAQDKADKAAAKKKDEDAKAAKKAAA